MVVRGEIGHYPRPHLTVEDAERFNAALGIDAATQQAMLVGSMFGWHVPGADPAQYPELKQCKS